MEKRKMICFDMDGTIADFYGVKNWQEHLDNESVTPYLEAEPLWNMEALRNVCSELIQNGWEIRIITWLSQNSSESFKKATREAKWTWLAKYDFPLTHVHMIAYGTTKANSVRNVAQNAILIDDNSQIRDGWTLGKTIDPTTQNVIEELCKLLD